VDSYTALAASDTWRKKLEAAGFKIVWEPWPAPTAPPVLSPALQSALPARYV